MFSWLLQKKKKPTGYKRSRIIINTSRINLLLIFDMQIHEVFL